MRKYRIYRVEFKRQVASEFLAGGVSLHDLARKHSVSRKLVRLWADKFEAGQLDEEKLASEQLAESEAKIAALERLVGRQALEIDFLKGALRSAHQPRNGPTSVISGPIASVSSKDVD